MQPPADVLNDTVEPISPRLHRQARGGCRRERRHVQRLIDRKLQALRELHAVPEALGVDDEHERQLTQAELLPR